MNLSDVKYAPLFDHIKNNHPDASKLLKSFIPEAVDYMCRVYRATPEQAEEALSAVLFKVVQMIYDERMKPNVSPVKYLIKSTRNQYFIHNRLAKRHAEYFDENHDTEPEQIEHLHRSENMRILPRLINRLGENPKAAILHYLENPTAHYRDAAEATGMTPVNLRTAKSRAVGTLSKYYKQIEKYGT